MTKSNQNSGSESEAQRLYEISSGKNRNLFLFYLVAIGFILVISFSTTDLDLLLPDSTVTLPVFFIDLPLLHFYVLAPPLVLAFHYNLLHNSLEHLKKIEEWKRTKGGEAIPSYLVQPYIFDFAYLYPRNKGWQPLILFTNFLFVFLAPVCLFYIQWRFSYYQDLIYSSWHLFLLLIDLFVVICFLYKKADTRNAVCRNSKNPVKLIPKSVEVFLQKFVEALLISLFILSIFLISLANFCVVYMLQSGVGIKSIVECIKDEKEKHADAAIGCIKNIAEWIRDKDKESADSAIVYTKHISELIEDKGDNWDKWEVPVLGIQIDIIPRITIPPGTWIRKQTLEELAFIEKQTEVETTGSINTKTESDKNESTWEKYGSNYDLSGRLLVFAKLRGCDMRKINLQDAHLQYAEMQDTSLQKADMSLAKLQGAYMYEAQLQGAYMRRAQLQGADMSRAKLQGADMSRAKLQGAGMRRAKLQGADMGGAQLQGADMSRAQLQGADMGGAKLQGADMSRAQLQGAYMYEAQLQGAYMRRAQLQGADMSRAKLQGADMSRAKLQGAGMRRAKLQGADMGGAQLQGADMSRAQLQGADMGGAKLQGADMRKAQLNGSFCTREDDKSTSEIEDKFFNRISKRINQPGLEECASDSDSFGELTPNSVNTIIEDLHETPEEIIVSIVKKLEKRIGKTAVVEKEQKDPLTLTDACEIIQGWEEGVQDAPALKNAFTDWLVSEGKGSDLEKECVKNRRE